MTTPVLSSLKQKFPDSRIDFLVKQNYADAVRYNPAVSNLFIYKVDEFNNLKNDLISAGYDLIFDLQNNFRSRKISKTLGTKTLRYSKPTLEKFLLVNFKINLLKDIKTIPQRYAEAFDELKLGDNRLELFYPETVNSRLAGDGYIGFCPGSKHFTKRWPSENFIGLGKNLLEQGEKIVLFGGLDDKDICTEIAGKLKGSINLQNDDNLFQTAADMKKCKLIVTNDSGLMHTAAAVGIPVVAIFGSSVKEFGFSPYGVKNLVLENKSLNCRPCSHIGRSNCPKKHFKCMNEIKPSYVQSQLLNFPVGI